MALRTDHARLIVFCDRLAHATLSAAAEWRGEGDDHYKWERAEGSVSIGARDRDGQAPYELAVFNGAGDKVEELVSALVDDEPAEWNEPLAELYRVARRSALHADEIIEALMKALPKQGGDVAAERDVAPAERTSR
jgi:ankyrin repeat protein